MATLCKSKQDNTKHIGELGRHRPFFQGLILYSTDVMMVYINSN